MRDKLHRLNNSRSYNRAVDDAHFVVKKAIKEFNGSIAVGVSGGKDSVAMAHVVAQHCEPLIIWNDSGLELPESKTIVDDLALTLGLEVAVAKGVDALERKSLIGRQEAEKRAKETDRLCIIEPVKVVLKEHGIVLEFVGLREKESRNRRILIRTHGPVHNNKRWECGTAWPMRWWSAADVFAYIDQYKLPLHPAYLRDEWQDRDSIRVSWLWDSTRENQGDLIYLRKYYPRIYRAIRSRGCIDAL